MPQHGSTRLCDQPRRALEILPRERMLNCLSCQAVALVPLARAAVQLRHPLGLRLLQAIAQQIRKEVVIAIPAPLFFQRNEEQIGPLQPLQDRLAVVLSSNRVTEWTTQAIEDGRLQQEALDLFGLASQYLFNQIIHNVVVAPSERLNEC